MRTRQVINFVFAVLFIVFVSLLQSWRILDIGGITPNIALVAVIATSFFLADLFQIFVLALIAVTILNWQAGVSWELVAFVLVAVALAYFKKFLKFKKIWQAIIIFTSATIIFYILTAPAFILSHPMIFLGELVYNLALGLAIVAVAL